MQKSDLQKLGLFLSWLIAITYVGIAISDLQKPTDRVGESIAFAKRVSGRVQYKTGDRIAWFDVGNKHQFYSGDVLATPPDGGAIIEFTGGGEVKVGPNSQIRLSAIKSASSMGLYIDLLQGDLDANATKIGATNFLIKAGGEEIVLDKKGQSVSIAKAQGQNAVVEKRETGAVPLALAAKSLAKIPVDSVMLKSQAVPPVVVNIEPKPAESEVKQPVEAKKRSEKFRALFVDSQLDFWIVSHPQQVGGLTIPVTVQFDVKRSMQSDQLFLGFFGDDGAESKNQGARFVVAASKVDNNRAVFQIPVSELFKNYRLGSSGWFTSIKAALSAGIAENRQKDSITFLLQRHAFELKTLLSASQRPTLVQVDSLAVGESAAPVDQLVLTNSKENLPFRFQFERASDIALVRPLFTEAKKVNVRDGSYGEGTSTLNFVKDGRVILSSAKLSMAQIKGVVRLTGSDMVFVGAKDSLLNLRNIANGGLSSYLRQQVDMQKQLFVASGSRVVPINIDFLLKSPEARSYMNNQANAFFKTEVKVLVAR